MTAPWRESLGIHSRHDEHEITINQLESGQRRSANGIASLREEVTHQTQGHDLCPAYPVANRAPPACCEGTEYAHCQYDCHLQLRRVLLHDWVLEATFLG